MPLPKTRPSLIARIQDPSEVQAWSELVEIYAPVIYRFARRAGLQDADAQDLTQEVLEVVAGSVADWNANPSKGSFRGWLYGITRNKLRRFWERQQRDVRASGNSDVARLLAAQPADDGAGAWDNEYRHQLFDWATTQVRGEFSETTWQAFWQNTVQRKEVKEIACLLGITPGTVYVYSGRVMRRIKQQIRQITDEND